MLYAGLDLSRKRLDFHLLDGEGATVEVGAAPPDADGLRGLGERLELAGWQVEIADAQKVKGWRRLPARPTASTPGCWPNSRGVTWCQRSGYPIRSCVPSASGALAAAPRPPPLESEAVCARGLA